MNRLLTWIWSGIKKTVWEIYLFLTSWVFLKNLLALVAVLFLLSFLTFRWLHCYTDHGSSLQVHDYIGMDVDEAIKLAKSRSFNIEVTDSMFIVGARPNTVRSQHPRPMARVKKNRTIYLSVTKRLPEPRRLPDLRAGNDGFERFRQKCEDLDVHVKKKGVEFNNVYADNTILKVFYKGEDITDKLYSSQGARVNQTDTIEVIVSAKSEGEVAVPDLICRRLDAARFLINSYNLTVGVIHEDATVVDRNTAYVYKQEPSFSAYLPVGAQIHLHLTQEPPANCGESEFEGQ